jgi:hypothetical protein
MFPALVLVDNIAPQEATRRLLHDELTFTDVGLRSEEDAQLFGPFHIPEFVAGRGFEAQRENPVAVDGRLGSAADDLSYQGLRDCRVRTSGLYDDLLALDMVVHADEQGLVAWRGPGSTDPVDIDWKKHLVGRTDRPCDSFRATDPSRGPAPRLRMKNIAQALEPVVGFENLGDFPDAAMVLGRSKHIDESILGQFLDVDMEAI